MNHNKSNAGDWAFLIGGVGAIGGYFIYENSVKIANWLAWLQSLANAPIAPAGGLMAWLIGNWGLVLLIAAIIFAVFKLSSASNTTAADGSNTIRHKSLKHVNIKLIR